MNARTELTRNQTLVLDILGKAEAPLGAYTILERLREEGFRAPLQVYRALDKLQEFGLVHRLESLNAFVACSHPHAHSHAHERALIAFAICKACGRVEEFADEVIEARLGDWAATSGFRPENTVIEIRGLCRQCAS